LIANVRGSEDVRNAGSKYSQDLRMCLMRSKSHYFTPERLTIRQAEDAVARGYIK
jgi:hypothetical protein